MRSFEALNTTSPPPPDWTAGVLRWFRAFALSVNQQPGLHTGRAAGGQHAGANRHRRQQRNAGEKGQRIGGAHLAELALQQACGQHGPDNACRQPKGDRPHGLAHHQADDLCGVAPNARRMPISCVRCVTK